MKHRQKSAKGFTLVELLVVIGIIALLISILLPALNKARQSAQAVACASNLRQIGMGFEMYGNAQKQWYPMDVGVYDWTWPDSSVVTLWYAYVSQYMGWNGNTSLTGFVYPRVLDCPSYDRTVDVQWSSTSANWTYVSYGYNYTYFGYYAFSAPSTQSRTFRRTQIKQPSDKIVVSDALYMLIYPVLPSTYPLQPRHSGRCNVLFADGHVTSMTPTEMIGSGTVGEPTFDAAFLKHWYNHCYTPGAWN